MPGSQNSSIWDLHLLLIHIQSAGVCLSQCRGDKGEDYGEKI